MTGKSRRLKPIKSFDREVMPNLLWSGHVAGICGIITWLTDEVRNDGFGPDLVLSFKVGPRAVVLDLTQMTQAELGTLKETLDNAFSLAQEISLGRDKKAEELIHAGSDRTFKRLYRPISQVVTGPGARSIDVESLLSRPVNVSEDDE